MSASYQQGMSLLTPSLGYVVCSGVLLAGSLVLTATSAQKSATPKPSAPAGEKLFDSSCAPCHGKGGRGGPGFKKPLVGTRSVGELANFVHKSMPPGGSTPLPEAKLIASYMHEAFYSPIAQDRNRPARVEVSRLTVRQFRNAITDLIGDYRDAMPGELGTGLKGQYFRGRDFWKADQKAFERTDAHLDFDFGLKAPSEDKFDPHNFSMVWNGSLVAPDSGEYEIITQSNHSVKVFVNFDKKPLIDAWVKSGSDTEFKAPITLLGGRSYPIRVEFSKATQGVNDDDKKKNAPVQPAFVRLMWRRPKMGPEVIPTPYLYPSWTPPSFVLTTPFPPDDRSIGYERGTSVSKSWEEATTQAALEAGSFVAENLDRLANTDKDAKDRLDKVRAYAEQLVTRAFRRPLNGATKKLYIEKQFERGESPEATMKRITVMTVKSPRFLYLEEGTRPRDAFGLASHLSFGMWDTLPSPQLMQAAARGELNSPEQFQKQAEAMADNPRAWNKLRDYLLWWLKIDETPDIIKSQKLYPAFDEHVATDLRTSLELGLRATAGGASGTYRDLLLSQKQFLNGRLAKVYAQPLDPKATQFRPVTMDNGIRRGILGHPYILSHFSYLEGTSPIHRGVLIARNMLGRTLAPPPAAFVPLAASLHPRLTTRQRVALQTKPDACNTCHSLINPLGFSLERYDAIGRLRDKENGTSVDSSGYYRTRDGNLVRFNGATDLAKFLAASEEAQSAFVEKLFHHMVKQPVLAYSASMRPTLRQKFVEDDTRLRGLMVNILTSTAPFPAQATAK